MNRKYIIIISGCAVVMSLILFGFYASSPLNEPIFRNSFSRNFVSISALTQVAKMELSENDFYISGATEERIYLSSVSRPFNLLVTNMKLTNTQEQQIKLLDVDSIRTPWNFRTKVEPPLFFLANGVMPIIMRGDTSTWEAKSIPSKGTYFFNEYEPIGKYSFALRAYSRAHSQLDLAKRTAADTPEFKFFPGILKKQLDGMVCVHGTMNFNKHINRLVYVYLYRNQYISLDSNLNIVDLKNTIDTFKTAHISLENTEKNISRVGGASIPINIRSSISNEYLFIQSNLMANNEDEKMHAKYAVIDIYDFVKGNYLSSFYIPEHPKNTLIDFKTVNQHIVVLFKKNIIVYKIPNSLLLGRSDNL